MTFLTTLIVLTLFYGGGYALQQAHPCDDVNRVTYMTKVECEAEELK